MENPLTRLVVGLILVGTAISEIIDDLSNARQSFHVGVHHGVLIYGILQVLESIPILYEGFDRWCAALPDDTAKSTADENSRK